MRAKLSLALAITLLAASAALAQAVPDPNGVPNTGGLDKSQEKPSVPQPKVGDASSSAIGGMGTKAEQDGKGGPTNKTTSN